MHRQLAPQTTSPMDSVTVKCQRSTVKTVLLLTSNASYFLFIHSLTIQKTKQNNLSTKNHATRELKESGAHEENEYQKDQATSSRPRRAAPRQSSRCPCTSVHGGVCTAAPHRPPLCGHSPLPPTCSLSSLPLKMHPSEPWPRLRWEGG